MSEVLKELAAGIEAATEILNKNNSMKVKLSVEPGKVWTRIVCTDINKDGIEIEHGRRCWGFVDLQGNLWKCASWKAPAKNKARGVIADLHNQQKVENWRYGGVQ